MNEKKGRPDGAGKRVSVVVSRFNAEVTEALLEGALATLAEHGAAEADVEVIRVPGAWELPGAVGQVLRRGSVDAVVALGCVIRGETPHFEYVAGEAARGLGALAARADVPVIFGVLTTDTLEQALIRAGGKGEGTSSDSSNKGREAVLAALEMADLYRMLR